MLANWYMDIWIYRNETVVVYECLSHDTPSIPTCLAAPPGVGSPFVDDLGLPQGRGYPGYLHFHATRCRTVLKSWPSLCKNPLGNPRFAGSVLFWLFLFWICSESVLNVVAHGFDEDAEAEAKPETQTDPTKWIEPWKKTSCLNSSAASDLGRHDGFKLSEYLECSSWNGQKLCWLFDSNP